jgi:hypothetical protein
LPYIWAAFAAKSADFVAKYIDDFYIQGQISSAKYGGRFCSQFKRQIFMSNIRANLAAPSAVFDANSADLAVSFKDVFCGQIGQQ